MEKTLRGCMTGEEILTHRVGKVGLLSWVHKTQSWFLCYYYLLMIALSSIWTTVNLFLPHPVFFWTSKMLTLYFCIQIYSIFISNFSPILKRCKLCNLCIYIWFKNIATWFFNLLFNIPLLYYDIKNLNKI